MAGRRGRNTSEVPRSSRPAPSWSRRYPGIGAHLPVDSSLAPPTPAARPRSTRGACGVTAALPVIARISRRPAAAPREVLLAAACPMAGVCLITTLCVRRMPHNESREAASCTPDSPESRCFRRTVDVAVSASRLTSDRRGVDVGPAESGPVSRCVTQAILPGPPFDNMAAVQSRKRRAPAEDCFELTPSEAATSAPKQVRIAIAALGAIPRWPHHPPTEPRHLQQMRLERSDIGFAPLRRAALAVVQVPTDFNMDSEVRRFCYSP